jgi:probable Rubsico expression protein CbbX
MWTARLRYSGLGLLGLVVGAGTLLAWLRLSHGLFAVIACSLAIVAGLFAVARDGFRQTTPAALVSRGIDPTDDNYSPVSDSNLRRDWTPLLSATVSQRMARKKIRRVVAKPPGRGRRPSPRLRLAFPAPRPWSATFRPAAPASRPAAPGSRPAVPAAARPGPARGSAGQARPRTEALAPDATVNFAVQRREAGLDELLAGLDRELIGLAPVKQKMAQIGSLLLVDQARQRFGLSAPPLALHMCFTGPPGTGKTTVALRMAELLRRLGYLETGQVVHAMRDDLVGEFIGQTAPRTRQVLQRAMGGVLFIDEAYSLYRDDDPRDYGQECIDILMQVMENQRDQLVVIFAGYRDPMERFFDANPGLRSRIAHHLDFAPYQAGELLAISQLMLERSSYYLSAEAAEALRRALARQRADAGFGNARGVRNALERARLQHAYRLTADLDRPWAKDDLMRLEPPDVAPGADPG